MLRRVDSLNRQRRLRDAMQRASLDVVVLTLPHHVYWLTGHRPHWLQQAAAVMTADGRSLLVAADPGPAEPASDELRVFQASLNSTQRQEQPALVAAVVTDWLASQNAASVGVDAGSASVDLARQIRPTPVSIDSLLWQLRRPKEPDELTLMRRAIVCTEAMYQRAKEIIEPGVAELTVFTALHAAAVAAAGEPLSAILGNDFACGAGGGPARAGHVAAAGQLYILDLGPAVGGYFADNARTYAVDRKPTDAQLEAVDAVTSIFPLVEAHARPGVSCRSLYELADAQLRDRLGVGLVHHLGHGVGLEPHEFPHLNPGWDDTLVEGEVFTVEPGVYGPHLGGGIRIENQYLVTADGVRNLVDFPTALI